MSHKTLLFTLLLSSPILLFGEIRPSPLFSEHAVLAKREDVAIWGDAAPGERVEVTVAGAQAAVNANAQGNWRVTLNLADAPFGPHEMRIGAQVIPDVLIGETWLASGQSNVMLNLFQTEGAEEEIAKSTDNLFRFFWIDINPQDKKQPRLTGKWVVANPKTSPRIT
ncbi:MAG: hypothetical protein IKR81_09965, partial [Victivallales bacterium]|nr:hypothetical protein [Victivallales bacterium]